MGLMGERMSDYDKLVEILRSYSTEVISYKIDGTFAYAVTAAADAIEKLVKDRNVLQLQNHLERCEHEHTRKERDAAIADLKQASKIPYGGCHLCTSIRTEICKECYRSDMFAEIAKNPTDHWEWRGVQEEENGTEI